jgi:hypothetical protein
MYTIYKSKFSFVEMISHIHIHLISNKCLFRNSFMILTWPITQNKYIKKIGWVHSIIKGNIYWLIYLKTICNIPNNYNLHLISNKCLFRNSFMICLRSIECKYSQTCIRRSHLGRRKSGLLFNKASNICDAMSKVVPIQLKI